MRPLLMYVHGFNSSSQSQKAQEVLRYVDSQQLPIDCIAPTFPNYPGEAYAALEALIQKEREQGREQIALIASSLGGFMSTVVAEKFGLKVVLINPVVRPYELIQFLLGENTNEHTGEVYVLTDQHTKELKALEVKVLQQPLNYWVMLQMGDTTLDYTHSQAYYRACPQLVEEGGSHRFEQFEQHLPKVITFLELA